MDWSYNGDYTKDTMLGSAAPRVEARQRFGIDVARPNVAGLVKAGVGFIVPPELGRDRILCAARARTGAHRGQYCCVLRTRTKNVSLEQLNNLVEDTRLAEEAQNGS